MAVDLHQRQIAWRVANGGNGPIDHPLLNQLDLPYLGTNARAAALVTKSLPFATEGSGRTGSASGGGDHLRVFDKSNGELLAKFKMPGHVTGVPMTYLHRGKQYVVIAIGTNPSQLIALSL